MALHNAPAKRNKKELVLGVGRHAYINWLPPAGQPSLPVPMTDGTGQRLGNDLIDGQEVEIVSWHPRSREGLAYQIRRLSDGSEWWIAATYLRRLPTRSPEAGAADRPTATPGNGS